MAAWQVQEQTCYCPESVKVSGHVSSDIKTTWSKNVVKVSIGVIHTTRPDRPSISNVNVANRREIDVRHLPSSLLCYWLHPCEAWELFYSYHAGHRVTDYLTVSVEIDLKTSAARASPFETQKSSEAILRGIVHNLRRVTRAMADMVDVHQGPRLIPVLNITVDASNTPKQHADELCRFMMGLVGNIAALAKELPDTSDDAAAWYDLTVRSIIDIDIGRLRMADCGLEAKQLLRLNNVDQRWVSKLDYHVKLHHLDVSSNSIDGDDALQSKSHRGLSFLSILCLVCGTIPEVDISWNPTGCVTLLRKEFIISSTTRVIGAYAILPSEHNPTKTTVPPKRAHTNQLLRQGDHPKPSALEWEGILTTLLSSKIAETLKNIKGLKRYHGYIRVFGSALSGFSLPGSVSDVDAVVLLRDKETTIDAGLTEGK
ncbi:hypothetical protein FOL47_007918 [Perkinsus chesapeaki]|uniref:Uncharacterized protein n=1 Tax=Perkinsus chesapeaki TaxID=330153 RepID=A0A7J6LGY2_PERCH|nr:hypothetical protein FOL47_007918 [Perkinsus chesapeaki]